VPLPNAVDAKQVVEAANAVRGALNLRSVSWDDVSRTLVIRDRADRARLAASLLQAVTLPPAELSIKVEILAIDSARSYHYGVALPTSFPAYVFPTFGNLHWGFPDLSGAGGAIFAFGGGPAFFGVALGSATLFGQYTKSLTQVIYEATVAVQDGQSANLHVGDKYPIPQSLYTGGQSNFGGGIYNPIGQVTMEDLGILLKLSPHVNGNGQVAIDIEAEYKALSGQTFNTVPAIAQRTFKGSVRLTEDQYAIIAGLNENDSTVSRSGLVGLSQIPGVNQILAENRNNRTASNTLILIKPTITRLPMDATVSPQFLLGAQRGARVLL
jgi:general secretion pathway protein D